MQVLSKFATLLLLFGLLPAWIAVGFADYWCHRAGRIEMTAGTKESWMHLLGVFELSIPILAALFCELTALNLLLLLACLVLHELTILWDIRYAGSTRPIGRVERALHRAMEILPAIAFLLLLPLCWGQACALVGIGDEEARWSLLLRAQPLPLPYLSVMLGAALLFNVLPFAEELLRGLRVERSRAATSQRVTSACSAA